MAWVMASEHDLGRDLAQALDLEEGNEREAECLEVQRGAQRDPTEGERAGAWRISRGEKPGSSARSVGTRPCG